MFKKILLLILISTKGFAAQQAVPKKDETLQIVFPQRTAKFTLKELKSQLESHSLTVDDPVYKKKKTYDAFKLEDLFKKVGTIPTGVDELKFEAIDGYAPTLEMAKLDLGRAYIAYQEHARANKWEKFEQGKAKIDPGPFYLVWGTGPALDRDVPWPYQMVKIELISFAEKYSKLYPAQARAGSAVQNGFKTFKSNCLRCHSVNLQGGDLGPELNYPKNILEYWATRHLAAFIRDASSYRAKSKMPSFKNLTDHQIDELLEYFDYMKDHKMGPDL